MADLLCQQCRKTMDASKISECPTCHKILCDSCKGSASTCKDSKSGTAGCGGHFNKRK